MFPTRKESAPSFIIIPSILAGFYGVTYCLGFRDDFDVEVRPFLNSSFHGTEIGCMEGRGGHQQNMRTRNVHEPRGFPEGGAALERGGTDIYTHVRYPIFRK